MIVRSCIIAIIFFAKRKLKTFFLQRVVCQLYSLFNHYNRRHAKINHASQCKKLVSNHAVQNMFDRNKKWETMPSHLYIIVYCTAKTVETGLIIS